jgi:hypothetical protein
MEDIMRRLIEKLGVVRVGFICVFAMMFICTLCIVSAIESLENTIRETNESSTPTISMSYEKPEEEIVPVYYEKQEDGDMIYEFGDMSDDAYFFIIINEEQGVYEYYWPAMSEDWPLEYDSLAELQDSVICHIDQEWPNATFAMEWRY